MKVHVKPYRGGGWAVEFNDELIEVRDSAAEAEEIGQALAKKKKVEVVLYKADGTVRDTYDPRAGGTATSGSAS